MCWKAGSACRSPRPFLIRAAHCFFKGGRQRSHGSVNFQLTPLLGAHAIILGCSQALPASVDVFSPSILTRRRPEWDMTGGRGLEMTPAGALKLPLPRWRSAQGGPEDGTPGGLILGSRPRPSLPRGPLLDPACSRCQGCSRRVPGTQRPPLYFFFFNGTLSFRVHVHIMQVCSVCVLVPCWCAAPINSSAPMTSSFTSGVTPNAIPPPPPSP